MVHVFNLVLVVRVTVSQINVKPMHTVRTLVEIFPLLLVDFKNYVDCHVCSANTAKNYPLIILFPKFYHFVLIVALFCVPLMNKHVLHCSVYTITKYNQITVKWPD